MDKSSLSISTIDAKKIILESLKMNNGKAYDYDIYLPNIIDAYITRTLNTPITNPIDEEKELRKRHNLIFPVFMDAAWELCLENLIRPSNNNPDEAGTIKCYYGYSLTDTGKKTLGV